MENPLKIKVSALIPKEAGRVPSYVNTYSYNSLKWIVNET